jgi:CubicO group peptidase (beta-lactamase class C family)
MHAAGGMVATAPDLGRYLRAVMNEGRLNGEQVLPAGAVREALAPQIRLDSRYGSFSRVAYGFGWHHGDYRGDRQMHHFGGFSGYFCHMSFMPEHNVGVVVLANGATVVPQDIAEHIYDLVLGRDPAAFAKNSARAPP